MVPVRRLSVHHPTQRGATCWYCLTEECFNLRYQYCHLDLLLNRAKLFSTDLSLAAADIMHLLAKLRLGLLL